MCTVADSSNELVICPRRGIDGSSAVQDGDDTHIGISYGGEGLQGQVEGSPSFAAVGAMIHKFHGDGSSSSAAIALALDCEVLATVVSVVPEVRIFAVASSCDEIIWWENACVVAITGRGYQRITPPALLVQPLNLHMGSGANKHSEINENYYGHKSKTGFLNYPTI